MSTKSFILSSAGLKNISFCQFALEEDFVFYFGESQIKMNSIFAEFISPLVSRIHQSDPTNNTIRFNFPQYKEIFSEDIISLIHQLSNGCLINITQEQSGKLRIISIFLENKELFDKINEIYPLDINEKNIDRILLNLQFFQNFTSHDTYFNYSTYLNFISSNFYSIDRSKLLKLPKTVLLSIIMNENLKIENEDSLFDFIIDLFSNSKDDHENPSIYEFYDQIEFQFLSKGKFAEFLKSFDFNEMNHSLWNKLCKCFYFNYKKNKQSLHQYVNTKKKHEISSNTKKFEYKVNNFRGIIHYLSTQCGGNVEEKGAVKVSSSSIVQNLPPRNVVDLDNTENYFQVSSGMDGWLKYDFKDKKVSPTHYTIRARHDSNVGSPSNFVIEGSNTDNDDDWKILDSQNDVTFLEKAKSIHTFTIKESNECYRFLRLRQTGPNIGGTNYYMSISALEYYGTLFMPNS